MSAIAGTTTCAYEEMIQATATKKAPWYIVPADDKWYARAVLAAAVTETLASLKLKYPVVSAEMKKELEKARAQLLGTKKKSDQQRNVDSGSSPVVFTVRFPKLPCGGRNYGFAFRSPDHVSFSVDPPCGFLSCFLVPASC